MTTARLGACGYLPAYAPSPEPAGASVFTLNSRCDSSGSDDLAASLLERQPDLVVLQGTSAALRERLGESGLWDMWWVTSTRFVSTCRSGGWLAPTGWWTRRRRGSAFWVGRIGSV